MNNLSKRKRRVITKRSGVLIATFLLCLLFNSIAFAAAGEGTVTMDNWIYGNTPANPVPASATNGTANVTYEYKTKGASDSTYTSQKPVNVGEYTVRATFASTANYDECKATHDFSITKRTLNVTANAQHREYKDANPNFTYAYSNNVASETPNFTGSLTTTATASSNVGTYDITLGTLALANDSASGFLANNYTLNYTKGTLTIDRKAIATPIANQNLVYTGSSITGVPAATDGSYTITGNTATNAGNYTAIATPTGNYMWNNGADVTSARNINWTINKKALNVIANNLQRAYGESNPTLTYTYNGQVNGQTPRFTGALATEATTESLSGLYDITQGTLALSDNGAFKANNYSINYTKGTLTIGRTPIPVPTAITGLVYDGTLKLGVLESDKYTVTGNKQSVAGNYTAIAVPGDNYEWNVGTNKTASVNIEWSIAKRDINQATVTLESNAIQYTGTEIIPSMVITYNSMILSENIDYTVTCENNVNVSSTTNKAKVIITGIGENYTGTKTIEFNITSKIVQEKIVCENINIYL